MSEWRFVLGAVLTVPLWLFAFAIAPASESLGGLVILALPFGAIGQWMARRVIR